MDIYPRRQEEIQNLWEKAVSSNSTPSTGQLLRKRSDEEKLRLERLSNPTFPSAIESERRAVALLAVVLGE